MHRYSVFKNSCVNVPIDPITKMPKTDYERKEKLVTEHCSIESSSCSGADIESDKFKDFYRSIPDYNDINHLSESEFYSTLRSLREKKKLMLGLAVENIDDCKINDDRFCDRSHREDNICFESKNKKKNRPTNRRKFSIQQTIGNVKSDSIGNVQIDANKVPIINVKETIADIDSKEINADLQANTKTSSIVVKGSKLDRPKRNHSACSISWHDDKIEQKLEENEKFKHFFEDDKHTKMSNDDTIYKTQSMPSSPLRMRKTGSSLRHAKSITIPKPFKMTQRDEDHRIVNDLRSIQKSFSEDMLHQKRDRKTFRANPVPIESRIPLYDKILQDQAMRRAITKINSEAELRAQMKPFSFTKREETGINGMCERAINVIPKYKKKKRFKARPVPKHLFSNYFYDKKKDDTFFRSLNRKIRAEEMLRNSNFPGITGVRDRSRLSTPGAHSDLPIDPSPAAPSISSSDRHRCSSPTKELRRTRHIKEDFVTTSPQPFRFITADRASKKINEISKKICQDSKSSGSVDKNLNSFDKSEVYSALDLKGSATGRSNLAALLRAEAVRQRFEMESARHSLEQRRRVENRQRDRILRAKPAWHLVKNNHEEDIAMRLQTRRDEERLRREEFLHEMELMHGRVQQQPMLFERYYAPRSGATTIDSVQISPRKPMKKKRTSKKSNSYHLPSPCLSSDY